MITFIDMIPDNKAAEFSKLTVGIEKSKMVVHSLVTHGKDGNLYGIYVNDMKTNQPVADTEFVFSKAKYPNIEVVDFR